MIDARGASPVPLLTTFAFIETITGVRKLWLSAALIAPLLVTACGGGAKTAVPTVTVTKTVTAGNETQPPPAPSDNGGVAVKESGFSQRGTVVGIGLILSNKSRTDDLLDVDPRIQILDQRGNILTTLEAIPISVIPAGDQSFYFGGSAEVEKGSKASKLNIAFDVGGTQPATSKLPEVRRLRIGTDEYGDIVVRGEVYNGTGQRLLQASEVYFVFFDTAGRVIGGDGFPWLDSDVPPGQRGSFDAPPGIAGTGFDAITRARLARVETSIAPSG